jgi:hypothetical protein
VTLNPETGTTAQGENVSEAPANLRIRSETLRYAT